MLSPSLPVPFVCELRFESDRVTSRVSDSFTVRPVFQFDKGTWTWLTIHCIWSFFHVFSSRLVDLFLERYACQIEPVKDSNSRFYVSTIKSDLILSVSMKQSVVDTTRTRIPASTWITFIRSLDFRWFNFDVQHMFGSFFQTSKWLLRVLHSRCPSNPQFLFTLPLCR